MKIDKIVLDGEKTREVNAKLEATAIEKEGFCKRAMKRTKAIVTSPVVKRIGSGILAFGAGYLFKGFLNSIQARDYEVESEMEPSTDLAEIESEEEVKVEI